ncbi:MAG: cystathionine beta-lyase [Thermomicrobiales bacterium]|nr:cystathionine beta-lyase [Thermomicrobiales bacterium]
MSWRTRLIHSEAGAPPGFRSLTTPVHRGSTTVFARTADLHDEWRQGVAPYGYGLYGTPTTLELAARIGEIEGATHTLIVPGGQAAIALVYLAFATPGAHMLVPESIYGPSREIANDLLRRFGVEIEFYDPLLGAGIAALLRETTRLVWCESPGSVTMEVQDVPAIVAAAHARGAVVAIDNTYAAGVLFDAFGHGADISVQALTKYIGGHSDLLLGSVSLRDDAVYDAVGNVNQMLGMAVSPDDCSLALRGLQTLGVQLERLEASTLTVARWLAARPEIATVLHPALPSCPGHETWVRDFTGSASVFSVVFREGIAPEAILAFIDRLRLFKIGYSWGGQTSLVVPHFDVSRQVRPYGPRLVRFNIGLEDSADLIADLGAALAPLAVGAPVFGAPA